MWSNLSKTDEVVKSIEKQVKKDGNCLRDGWWKEFAVLIDTDESMVTYLTLRHRPTKTMITTGSLCNIEEDDFNNIVGLKICANRMARSKDFLDLTLAISEVIEGSLENFLTTLLGLDEALKVEIDSCTSAIWDC